tara:strand:+ start:211 stop:582 length:372 start_codon:yes stop_codon:yes gene_type:complete
MTYNIFYIPKVLLVVSYFQNACQNVLMKNEIIAQCTPEMTHIQCCKDKALDFIKKNITLDKCYNESYANYTYMSFNCIDETIESRVNGWHVFGSLVLITFSIMLLVVIYYRYYKTKTVVYNNL